MARTSLILATGMVSILAAVGQAATRTWDGSAGTSWTEPTNWSGDQVPGSGDDVVIPSGAPNNPTYDETTNTTIQSLEVQSGRILNFDANKTLTVTGAVTVRSGGIIDINGASSMLIVSGANTLNIEAASGGIGTQGRMRIGDASDTATLRFSGASSTGHTVNGDILFLNASSMLDVTESVKLLGTGQLVGNDAAQQIVVASTKTFTNAVNGATGLTGGIRGALKIAGTGTFINEGRVEASGGVFEMVAGLAGLDDGPDAKWVISSTSGSQLQFSRSAEGLEGDFITAKALVLGAGVNVWTCGDLTYNGGSTILLDADNDRTFMFKTFNMASTCDNPDADDTADNDSPTGCDDVFVVDDDHSTPCT